MEFKTFENTHSWKNHPWTRTGLVELVPTEFLYKLRNPNSTTYTDNLKGEIHPEEVIWKEIMENGMYEPFLLTIGRKDKSIRLEAGNHRIKFAMKEFTHVPVALFIEPETCIVHPGNGSHMFMAVDIVDWDSINLIHYVYQEKPSNVLKLDGIKRDF